MRLSAVVPTGRSPILTEWIFSIATGSHSKVQDPRPQLSKLQNWLPRLAAISQKAVFQMESATSLSPLQREDDDRCEFYLQRQFPCYAPHRITCELIAEYLPLAEAKRIDLGLDETEPLCARTLPERLRIILKNALENAMKYTPNGGVITVRLSESDGDFIIEVIDNGPGTPALEHSHVLTRSIECLLRQARGAGSD
ncbi:MAG: histidine kinase [Herminiimonas sp.]|nr:histidine kinase [Herminiimonas sp.]